mgnify:CR=1 FL=1
MAQQIIQQLTVYLKGGQTVVVPFNAEKAEVLNPQNLTGERENGC